MTERDLNEEATGGDEAEASQTTESPFAQDEVPQSAHLLMQGGIQLMALISEVILWGAADTWALSSDLALAGFFALIASIAFGIVVAQVLHEWSHFAGAVLSGAAYTVKEKPAVLFFDFDYERNSTEQFQWMSVAGTLGNFIFILLILMMIPIDSSSRAMLLAVGFGMTAFVAVIEWPVIRLIHSGLAPMDALVRRFGNTDFIQHALIAAVGTTLLVWMIA